MAAVLAVATVVVYLPVRKHPFFYPDDGVYLLENLHVQAGLCWDTFLWAFRSFDSNWHPLTWLAHALDCEMFGLNPAGHHLINLFLHVAIALLLFWVLQKATGYGGRSLMVALLFALHPVNVEPVVWAAELKTLLSTLFFVLALGAYNYYVREGRESLYWLVVGFFVLGLLAKPQVITLPFLLLVWDYWPLRRMFAGVADSDLGTSETSHLQARSFWWLVQEKFPLFAFAGADALITIKAQALNSPMHWRGPFPARLENAIVSYARYIGKVLWPVGLAPHYPHPEHYLPMGEVLGCLALLLAITAFVIATWRWRFLTVGWLWFLIAMAPMIGLLQVGKQAMADRYAYQPFVGLFVMICWGIAELSQKRHVPALVLPVISVAIAFSLALVARNQVNYWRDDLTIWSHTLQVTKNNFPAEYHMGLALLDRGDKAGAMQHFFAAHALELDDPFINEQIAFYEHQNGDLSAALKYYDLVVHSPDRQPQLISRALANMGHIYQRMGDSQRAAQCWRDAEKFDAEASNRQR